MNTKSEALILLGIAPALMISSCEPTDPSGDPKAPTEAFVQDRLQITLPVRHTNDEEGVPIVNAWPDGGTTMITITDAAGKEWDIYFDRRLKESPSPDGQGVTSSSGSGAIYLNAYPGKAGSVLVIDQERFKRDVLRGIDYKNL